jgi:hypothetical protein
MQNHITATDAQADVDAPLSNRRSWQFHAERINAVWGRQTESIIETGKRLIEAHDEMERAAFEAMVQQKLSFGPPTARKLMVIARHPILTNGAHVHKWPPSWGTLYELSKLPDAQLHEKLKNGSITPRLERKEVASWRKGDQGEVTVDGKRIERKASPAEQLKAAKAEIDRLKQIVGGEHLFDPHHTTDKQIAETLIGRLQGWRGRARKVAQFMIELLDQQKPGGKKAEGE